MTEEAGWYLVAFWACVFSLAVRRSALDEFRSANIVAKCWHVLEFAIAVAIGLGLPLALLYLLASR